MNKAQASICMIFIAALVKMALYGLAITYTVLGLINLREVGPNFGGPTRDWKNDLISRFMISSNLSVLEEYEYVSNWTGEFPGTFLGCYCTKSYSRMGVRQGTFRGPCNRNQTRAGCRVIQPTPAHNLSKWVDQDDLVVVRYRNSSYLTLVDLMHENGTCVENTKKCSDFCVPAHWTDCPVTSIKIGSANPDPAVYRDFVNVSTGQTQYRVYWTKSDKFKTISDLVVVENTVSQSSHSWCPSPGRNQYPLLAPFENACLPDPRYERLQGQGEKTLLDINNVDISTLSAFGVSDDYKWYRFTGRSLHTKKECIDSQLHLQDTMSVRLDKTKNTGWTLAIIAWVFMGISLIFTIIFTCITCIVLASEDKFEDGALIAIKIMTLLKTLFELTAAILLVVTPMSLFDPSKLIFIEQTKDCYTDTYIDIQTHTCASTINTE
jgi:hypothetical protein